MAQEKFTFQTEVSRLLEIVAGSLYSHKEIFLRELISNASDACDKLRYAALTDASLIAGDSDLGIHLSVDEKAKTLSISDNGIGMNHDDLLATLGTIASSGTSAFLEQLSGDAKKDVSLIGQFGVGFYSAFMVADKVEVLTRKAGEDDAWLWISDGRGEFTIETHARDARGTTVTLHLKKDAKEFLDEPRIRHIVSTYSDHIGLPILLDSAKENAETPLNQASALWSRDKKDISDDQYKEFYHHVGHGFDEPWMTLHNKIEGVVSYTNLLYVPATPPYDLFRPERKNHLKLYVNRVFITDDCEELIPAYLRFLVGVVDSEDLSLNISREMLQTDPKLHKIRAGLVKRVLGEMKKRSEKTPQDFSVFWQNFGAVVKEGIYEDQPNRDRILEICRFRTTEQAETTLAEYVARMKDGQDSIYYITGQDVTKLEASPHLEGFKAKGIEVLLLSDPIDDFWVPVLGTFDGKALKSVTRGAADLDNMGKKDAASDDTDKAKDETKADDTTMDGLIAAIKVVLGEKVLDVRTSARLTDSPVCLVADESAMDLNLERMLKQHGQLQHLTPRVMEINPGHSLVKRMAQRAATVEGDDTVLRDLSELLLDEALIAEGEPVADPKAFARRLNTLVEQGLN